MKSRTVDHVTSNEEAVRLRIYDGELPIDAAAAELLRIERAQNAALLRRISNCEQMMRERDMTLSAQIPPPPAPPPASCLARCGACRWWLRRTAEIGLCETFDVVQRADAVACPSWRRRSVSEPRRADA